MTSDLERAFTALKGKQSRYALLYAYYHGTQPLQYATDRLRADFQSLTARWTENWCAVVVDSLLDRIQLEGFKLEEEAPNSLIAELWDSLDLSLDADDIARDVAVCSEGFLMVERDEAGQVNVFANPPHMCAALYREDDPREMELAAKWFERDGKTHLTLYYPDELVHYVCDKPRKEISEYKAFALNPDFPDGVEVNEYGRIPLFHFQRDRCSPHGELQNVMPLQDALNKLFADMMVAAEYGAYPQRWAIINASTQSSDLKAAPNSIMKIPYDAEGGEKPSVGQFDATQLKNFLDGIDHIAGKIAVISRTPKHYLLQQTGDPSGEALIAMESPLNRKAGKYTHRLGITWCQAVQFILWLSDVAVTENDIEPIWEDVRTVQPLTESEIRWNNQRAGIPVEVQLEDEGWTEEQIARIHNAETQSTIRQTDAASVARDEAMRRFAAGQVPGMPNAVTE